MRYMILLIKKDALTCKSPNSGSLKQPGGAITPIIIKLVIFRAVGARLSILAAAVLPVQRVPPHPDTNVGRHAAASRGLAAVYVRVCMRGLSPTRVTLSHLV